MFSHWQGTPHLQGCEVDHAVDVGMSLEDLIEILLFSNVHFHELGAFSRYELNPLKNLFARIVEVVTNDDLVSCLDESKGGEGPNIARSTAVRSVGIQDCALERRLTR